MNTPASLIDRLERGLEGLYSRQELARKLESGRTLRIKLGMDPTAPDIHLGHAVVLRKLRQFQEAGHRAVLIIGDYTAKIGDPTGRDTTRPVLDDAAITANARTYLEQAGRILDTRPERLEVRRNSEWLAELSFADVLRITGQVTVGQMLHRENFRNRMEAGREIQLTELLYPVMQAWDSVVIEADVELGGTDQTFNNLMGRQLMEKEGQEKQVVMVTPILVGLGGHEKMSKSKGNTIGLTEAAGEMFGKLMSIPDTLMGPYFKLLTDLAPVEVAALLDPARTHPREAKDRLARRIVSDFHGAEAAAAASDAFRHRFAEGRLPDQIPSTRVEKSPIGLLNLIRAAGFAGTNSEARRLVEQGAVRIDGRKHTDPAEQLTLEAPSILEVGKRRVTRLEPGGPGASRPAPGTTP